MGPALPVLYYLSNKNVDICLHFVTFIDNT